MAVPKKRTGSSAQGHRRSNWKAVKPEVTKCTNCGVLALTHTVCEACGFYKGKAVSIKSPYYTEGQAEKTDVKADKKAKTVKKTTKTEKVETEVKIITDESSETVEAVKEVKEEAKTAKKPAAKKEAVTEEAEKSTEPKPNKKVKEEKTEE